MEEIGRKIIHMLAGIVLIGLLINGIIDYRVVFVLLVFSSVLSVLSRFFDVPVVCWFIKTFGKKEEWPGRGVVSFFLGVFIVLFLFPKDIALAAIAILSFSDSFSFLFGKYLGRTKIFSKTKNIEGILAGIIIGTFASMLFLSFEEAFIASFFGMVSEYWEMKIRGRTFDDNLLIPIVAAVSVYLFRILV